MRSQSKPIGKDFQRLSFRLPGEPRVLNFERPPKVGSVRCPPCRRDMERIPMKRQTPRAVARAEVAVIAATLSLLALILGPAIADGGRSTRATCLQNLRAIGMATQTYAEDDAAELLLPIHQMMVNNTALFGGAFAGTRWSWRTANWFAWGGATASERFHCDDLGEGPLLGQGITRYWGAQTRPLTRYLYPELTEDPNNNEFVTELPIFHCPQDAGYPDDPNVDDSPIWNAGRSCYTTLGNSYRASMNGSFYAGDAMYRGAFSYGPWGHKRSDLVNASRVVLIGEPIFFSYFSPVGYAGWHGAVDSDHVLYVDGSVRLTQWTSLSPISADPRLAVDSGFNDYDSRDNDFQLDCYPTPGALIWAADASVRWSLTGPFADESAWPYAGYKDNLEPVLPPWLPEP